MASGHIIVGEDLSLKGFDEHVVPSLYKKNLSIADKIVVQDEENVGKKAILISISNDRQSTENLESDIYAALANATEDIDKIESEARGEEFAKLSAHGHNIGGYDWKKPMCTPGNTKIYHGKFRVLGVYSDNMAASQVFNLIAQNYLIREVYHRVEELEERIQTLMEKKLSEI